MSKIFFVGDSITAGAWDEKGGWANRLVAKVMQQVMAAEIAQESFYCMPYNLGVSGNTVSDLLTRLKDEVTARVSSKDMEEKVEVVFSIGVNDSVQMINEDRPRFTDQEFLKNLEELVELSKSVAQRISFIGILPVNDDLLNPVPWAPEKAYRCENVARFEEIIASVCEEHDLPFMPLYETWRTMSDYKDYLIDGVHPNSKGHALLADQIERFILTDEFKTFHSQESD